MARTLSFDFGKDGRSLADLRHDHSHKTIGSAKSRIDKSTNTNQTSWNSELQLVLLSEERDDT
jgi:hypothetical protein